MREKNLFKFVLPLFIIFFASAIFSIKATAEELDPRIESAIYSLYSSGAYKSRIGDWNGALLDFERAYKLRQTSSELLYRYAEALLKTGRFKEAEKFASRALDEDSTVSDAYLILAELAMNSGDLDKADRYLSRRLELKKDDIESRMRLGLLRENRNDLEGVVSAFKDYPALKPGVAIANFHLGIALTRLKRYEEAIDAFKTSLRENPDYIEAAENIAILSEELNNDSETIEGWQKVLKIDPDRTEAYKRLITFYASKERYNDALNELEILLQRVPDKKGTLRKLMAQLALQEGDLSRAAKTMYELAELSGTETSYIEAALVSAAAKTETETLLSSLRGAWKSGRRLTAAITLAQAYVAAGRDSSAIKLLDTLQYDSISDSTAIFNLGLLWFKLGDTNRSIELFLALIERDPYNASALNFVGYTWAERGEKLDRAEEFIRRALAVEPQNPQYIDSLGWVFYQKGLYDIARLHLEKAYHLMPEEPEIMEHLGDVYAKLGRRDDAVIYYNKALELDKTEHSEILKKKISDLEL